MPYQPLFRHFLPIFFIAAFYQPVSHGMARMLRSIPAGYYWCMGMHIGIANEKTFRLSWGQRPSKKQWQRSREDAHKIVKDFVIRQLDPIADKELIKTIQVKHKYMLATPMSALDQTIYINTQDHTELVQLLQTNTSDLVAAQKDQLAFYTVVLNHEISHIKNKDSRNTRLLYPTLSILLHGFTWGVAKLCSLDHYYKPSHFEDSQSNWELFKGGAFLLATGIAQGLAHKNIINFYCKHKQELPADKYAYDSIKDPEILRGYAHHKATVEQNETARQLAKLVVKTNKQCFRNLHRKYYCYQLYKKFLQIHQQYRVEPYSEQAVETFSKWLLQNADILQELEKRTNFTHPLYHRRIEAAQKAADELERKQRAAAQYKV